MASADETSAGELFPPFGAHIERADSEYECELMIEALTKELTAVKVRNFIDEFDDPKIILRDLLLYMPESILITESAGIPNPPFGQRMPLPKTARSA